MQVESAVHAPVVSERPWYRLAEVSAAVLAVGYVAITTVYARVGGLPPGGNGEAWFSYLPGKVTQWWTILGLSVFTDLLYIPITYGLYLGLKATHKHLMVLAASFVGLFVLLDLAVTWSHYASVLILYRGYASASDDAHRMAYVAAASAASAVLTSQLEVVYAIVTLSLGILLIGWAMLQARFNLVAGYLGLATGVLGILALTGSMLAIIGNALCATAWLVALVFPLHRLARSG